MLEIVRKAADRIGGVPTLALRLGVTRQAIYQWREVPAERVGEICQATGIARAELRPDLFDLSLDEARWRQDAIDEGLAAPDFSALREDRLAWIREQVSALTDKRTADLDFGHLLQLLQSLERDAILDIERRLQVILVRLLKWRYRPRRRSLSTIGVINAERARVLARFAASPTLRLHASQALSGIYANALIQIIDETGLARDAFPVDCPVSFDELLDPAYMPAAQSDPLAG